MFRNLPVFELGKKGLKYLDRLAAEMTIDRMPDGGLDAADFENPEMPAGYTYLGQFIDHDITFDPVSSLQRQNDPDALHNFRTPRFDLDSLYGNGPSDQPYLYEGGLSKAPKELHGIALRSGKGVSGQADLAGPDLPRTEDGQALTGDPRNDENLVVSQLHVVFIKFHNAVVDRVMQTTTLRGGNLFKEAQRSTRWHYQWVVVKDFLSRMTIEEVLCDSFAR
jgi:hypothetical protein